MPRFSHEPFARLKGHPEERSLEENIKALSLLEPEDPRIYILLDTLSFSFSSFDALTVAVNEGIYNEIARLPMTEYLLRFLLPFMTKKSHRLPLIQHPAHFLLRFEGVLPEIPDHDIIEAFLLLSCSKESHEILLRPLYVDWILKMGSGAYKIFYNMTIVETASRIFSCRKILDAAYSEVETYYVEVADFIGSLATALCEQVSDANTDDAPDFIPPLCTIYNRECTLREYSHGTSAIASWCEFACTEQEELGNTIHLAIKAVAPFCSPRALSPLLFLLSAADDLYEEQVVSSDDYLAVINAVLAGGNIETLEHAESVLAEAMYRDVDKDELTKGLDSIKRRIHQLKVNEVIASAGLLANK